MAGIGAMHQIHRRPERDVRAWPAAATGTTCMAARDRKIDRRMRRTARAMIASIPAKFERARELGESGSAFTAAIPSFDEKSTSPTKTMAPTMSAASTKGHARAPSRRHSKKLPPQSARKRALSLLTLGAGSRTGRSMSWHPDLNPACCRIAASKCPTIRPDQQSNSRSHSTHRNVRSSCVGPLVSITS